MGELEPSGEDTALVGLVRSGLLKRLESSAYAFRMRCERMVAQHEAFLKGLDAGYVLSTELLHEWSAADDESSFDDFLTANGASQDVAEFNVEALRRHVQSDLQLLSECAKLVRKVKPERDPKLARLVEELVTIVKEAEREALDETEAQQFRKVLVFSQFEETIDWICDFVEQRVQDDERLSAYRGRLVAVAGSRGGDDMSREGATFGFAPISSEAPAGMDADRFDLMLSTDVLAEGVNLQQCRNVIKFRFAVESDAPGATAWTD